MNRFKLHTIANNILKEIEHDGTNKTISTLVKVFAEELKDPFASSIDEFLESKQAADKNDGGENNKQEEKEEKEEKEESGESGESGESKESDHPQEQAEEELEEEAIDYQKPEESDNPQEQAEEELEEEAIDYQKPEEVDHPQEQAEEELEEEAIDYQEPEESDHPQEQVEDELQEQTEDATEDAEENKGGIEKEMDSIRDKRDSEVESSLKRLGNEISKRGHQHLANRFIAASSDGLIGILNDLLMKEILIKDTIENYSYLTNFKATAKIGLVQKDNILFLQKQIVSLGGKPTTQRLLIPNVKGIHVTLAKYKKRIAADYTAAIQFLGDSSDYLTLKTTLQKIVHLR